MHSCSLGKLLLLDIGNNAISSKGAFHIAEYIKKSKSLLSLNLYMNDIGDEIWYALDQLKKSIRIWWRGQL
ncbi:hypothetical protein F0562_029985 [Nyssa sinensis]|uniref:Uncharacterized protein n=1 Tax=Nyssa sinensis TaxID=561372 RepID=A0A5J5AZ23_9ASTE|nr:hypothetical protein F0562_029985 [Nyssa sinensis]